MTNNISVQLQTTGLILQASFHRQVVWAVDLIGRASIHPDKVQRQQNCELK